MVQDARQALAEGREPHLPSLSIPSDVLAKVTEARKDEQAQTSATGAHTSEQQHRFGVTPDRLSAVPAHLRTSSIQVEPATPPRWMTEQEAEERVQRANQEAVTEVTNRPTSAEVAVVKKAAKKERPAGEQECRHCMKLGTDSSLTRVQDLWKRQSRAENQHS